MSQNRLKVKRSLAKILFPSPGPQDSVDLGWLVHPHFCKHPVDSQATGENWDYTDENYSSNIYERLLALLLF